MKFNKKFTALSLIAVLLLVFVSGCAKKEAPADSQAQDNTEKVVKLRLSTIVTQKELDADNTSMARGLNTWVRTVQEESNGTIEVKVFSDAMLAKKADETVNGIQTGGFEVSHFATGNWAEYTDAFAELNVPYLYSGFDSVHAVMDGEIGEQMMKKLEADVPSIKALAYMDIGFRNITNSKKPIKSPADMKGLKIRTMNDKLQIAAMEALGATVTPTPFSELYSALQQHLVDAQENPLSTIYSNKLYEVQSYATLSRHSFTSTFIFMNKKVYDDLSDNQKAAVDAASLACKEASRIAAASTEEEYADLLRGEGVEIYEPTISESKAFRAAASKAWTDAEKLMGEARYNALLETVEAAEK